VLLRGERAGAGELVVVGGTVDQVAAREDHVVRPGEQVDPFGQLGRFRNLRPLGVGGSGGDRTSTQDLEDVRAPARVRHVGVGPREGVVRDDVPVIGTPVVDREDLEEVRDPAELGDRFREPADGHVVEDGPAAVRVRDEP